MQTNCKDSCKPFISDHGEVVYELIGKATTKGEIKHSLAHIEISPGRFSLKHYHPEAEESYYILSGKARIVIENETAILMPGMSIVIPPMQKHQIFNDEEEVLVFLAVCVPAWTPECSVVFER